MDWLSNTIDRPLKVQKHRTVGEGGRQNKMVKYFLLLFEKMLNNIKTYDVCYVCMTKNF